MEEKKVSELKRKVYLLTLEGKEYKLRFDLNALSMLEEEFGSLNEAFSTIKAATQVKSVLYAATRVHHSELTREEIGAMIGLEDIDRVSDELTEAFEKSLPEENETDDSKKEKKPEAGKKSGSST